MKGKPGMLIVLTAIVAILFFSNIFFYAQYHSYKNENRHLILQNDSIMSANIHLKDTLEKAAAVGLLMK